MGVGIVPLPIVILPGYFATAAEYLDLEKSLQNLGFSVAIVPLRQRDWLPTVGGRSMIPILRQLDQTIRRLLEHSSAQQVQIIGHSAGGWIARIYLGEKPYRIHREVSETIDGLWDARARVATLVTLGTPHITQEPWARKNLDFVNDYYPGAFYSDVSYVCVAGKAIYGQRQWGNWLAYNSYKITCGQGNCWGDGITPVVAAHLHGAENLTLEGIRHSPRSAGPWYGSAEAMSEWVSYLI